MVTSTGLALMAVVASATSRDSVAVMPLASDRLEQPVVAAVNDLLLVAMDRRGLFEVASPADIRAQLGLAAMKQSLGCNDITCATELGGSLGVRYILTGSARKLGGRLILTVNLLDTRGQVAVGRGTAEVKATEAEYPGAIHAALDDLLDHVRAAQGAAYVWTGTTEGDRTWVVSFEAGKVMPVATVGNTNATLCVRTAN